MPRPKKEIPSLASQAACGIPGCTTKMTDKLILCAVHYKMASAPLRKNIEEQYAGNKSWRNQSLIFFHTAREMIRTVKNKIEAKAAQTAMQF